MRNRLCLLLVAIFLLTACGDGAEELVSLDDDLADAAADAVAKDGRLQVGEVTDFEWDQLVVFGPYTSSEGVEHALGVPMPRAAERRMHSDSNEFLAFVADGDLVAWAVLGNGRIVAPPAGVYEAEVAAFAVESRGDGHFALSTPGIAP